VALLCKGGVVAFPTDTLYGLGADFSSLSAVQRVIDIKGRPQEMGLPLLMAGVSDLSQVSRNVTDDVMLLANRFWPGALTIVVLRSRAVPDLVTGGRDTVALRVPDHPVPIALARGLGRPITGTSANRSGQPPASTAQEVWRQLGDDVDLVIKGGGIPHGVQSTIVDATGPVVMVLRQGAVSVDSIRSVYPGMVEDRSGGHVF